MDLIPEAKRRLESLEYRDRVALAALVAFLTVLFCYFALWMPIHGYYLQSLDDRDRQLGLLQYMKGSEQQARSLTDGKTERTGQSLIMQVSSSMQAAGIKSNRLQPEGGDAVSVWFDDVSFNTLISWLQQLQASQGITVRQISIDRRDIPGVVNARIVLSG